MSRTVWMKIGTLNLLLFAHGSYPMTENSEKQCSLVVTLSKKEFRAEDQITAELKVTNPGLQPAAVAKPLLPKRWSVRFVDRRPGKNLKREWVGGVIQGSTDSGQPPRYTDAEYEIIPPGGESTKSIDLGWFLRDQSPSLNSGEYEITFFYDHPPNESERDLPLIDYPLKSTKLRVIVLGG